MGKIDSRSDIDFVKLKVLFKKRGHGIDIVAFWKNLTYAIEYPQAEVHQCVCGEITIYSKSDLITLSRNKKGEYLCDICGASKSI